jgi:hypothetical protein
VDKNDPRRFDNLMILPFFVYAIDMVFSRFFYAAVGKGVSRGALERLASYGSGVTPLSAHLLDLLILYVAVKLWYRPIRRFVRDGTPKLKETVRRRISSVYPALFTLFGVLLVGKVLFHLWIFRGFLTAGEFFRLHLPGMLITVGVTLSFTLVMLDNALLGIGNLMERLYTREELYVPREGMNISFGVKIAMLLLSTAVAPMLLLYAYMRGGAATEGGRFASGGDLLM